MTNNEFTLLVDRLERIEGNQRDLMAKLDKMSGTDRDLGERVARLEESKARYVTYKQMLTWALGSAGTAGVASHVATRLFGG